MLAEKDLLDLSERARLAGELEAEGIHIALPLDSSAIAMLAAVDLAPDRGLPEWVPVYVLTMDADPALNALRAGFLPAPGLVIAVAHHLQAPRNVRTYALTAPELLLVRMVGAIEDRKAAECAERSRGSQLTAVQEAIAPYEMRKGQWRSKIQNTLSQLRCACPLVIKATEGRK